MKALSIFSILLFCVSIAYCVEETPYPTGNRPPTPEEQAYLDAHVVVIDTVKPNETAIARSINEAFLKGSMPETIGLPTLVDNSLAIYFPPIRSQIGLNSCAAFAAAYYFGTYTQAKDHGWNASSGNDAYICSPKFVYNLTTGGENAATNFAYSLAIQCEIGCSSWEIFPYDGADYITWPPEEAWIDALQKRMKTPYMIDASTPEGIEAVRQRLANGDICTSHFGVYSNFWGFNDGNDGIDNSVYYTPTGSFGGNHGSTLVGYDDNRSYVDHRDGQTYYGAFLCANSWGTNWGVQNSSGSGTRGFYWVAYRNFLEETFGPEVYFNSDRPKYQPRLYGLTRVSITTRGRIAHYGGMGPTASPLFETMGKQWDSTDTVPMDDSERIVVDITDGIPFLQPGTSNTIFTRINNQATSPYDATVTEAEFRCDLDATGSFASYYSSDPTFIVVPGGSGFATYQLVLSAPSMIYVDNSNTTGPWDGSTDHPFQTIQDGIDDATFGDTVIVRDGTYTGAGNKNLTFNGKFITVESENGPAATVIDCEDSGRGFTFDSQETSQAVLDGFTITNGNDATNGGGIFCWESSPVIKNCVLANNYAGLRGGGISVRSYSEPTIFNCLIIGNSSGEHGGGVFSSNGGMTIENCTIADNTASDKGGGITSLWNDNVSITNTIIWGNSALNGDQVAVCSDSNRSIISLDHCCIQGGEPEALVEDNCTLNWDASSISSDPQFTTGPDGNYYLGQTAAGQASDSPCLDAGTGTASAAGFDLMTTRTDGYSDTAATNMGYHYDGFIRIHSIEHSGTNTTIYWLARPGENYTVKWSTDLSSWTDVFVGETGSWTDTDATGEKKFYQLMGQ